MPYSAGCAALAALSAGLIPCVDDRVIAMLVLSRKVGQRILIGDDISITIVRIAQGGVRIGIEAPRELSVVREELKVELDAADEAKKSDRKVAL